MAVYNIRKEDHPVLGELLIKFLERDLTQLNEVYPDIDTDFINSFKQANNAVKEVTSDVDAREKLKRKTEMLYDQAEKLKEKIILLKDYMQRGKLNEKVLGSMVLKLARRNIEGALQCYRDALPYITENTAKMRMPSQFLELLERDIVGIEKENLEQNLLKGNRKSTNFNRKEVYKKHQEFISIASRSGKMVFKNKEYADDYNISKLMLRITSTRKVKEEILESKPKPVANGEITYK